MVLYIYSRMYMYIYTFIYYFSHILSIDFNSLSLARSLVSFANLVCLLQTAAAAAKQ